MNKAYLSGLAGLIMVAAPAMADVKQGVDAWSRGDYKTAVEMWRPLATAGDADAQFNLGQAYKLGRGVPVDLPMAIEWFRKAAVQGHAQAIDNYGLALFQDGKKAEALPWLEKSVARDEKRTQLVLGTMLFNADGVPRDWVRAYALVTRSSQQSLPQASQTLAQMDQYIPEADRQKGLVLARKYETDARAMAVATPPAPPTGRTAGAGAPTGMVKVPPVARPSPAARPTPAPRPVAAAPVPAPRPGTAAPVPRTTVSGGGWRIQLGAFRDESNARDLWAKVGARTGGSASYPKAGSVTRLQAGGFASKAAAQAACRKAGVACVVVAP
ncbi:SPOR domain-containing protein [Sphingomonas radiodurans]|uniref:SPOR domain-containing protein n=1 Tax=Sphingomonas radiodurans TaxID=2890321 RepID=UPI001E5D15BB|nr:SPOR domain-containing protein [Sphingomonas radiodurans]WBH16886.1 SPOR domain-containing protein [Sphingomonas radiodurans]